MKAGSIVVMSLHSPREKFFGRILEVSAAGVTARGVDLNAFEDWMNHINHNEESGVQPSTTFFPLHRVEKIMLDENIGAVPSLANTFLSRVGVAVHNHLESQ